MKRTTSFYLACLSGSLFAASFAIPFAHAADVPAQSAQHAATDVWVNLKSKVYHCPGGQWYGHTKDGAYMSEAAAVAAGDRPNHHVSCSQAAQQASNQPPTK